MNRKDRIDLFGALALITFSLLMGLNQALVKVVNEGMAPVFQAGLRSAVALPFVLGFALVARRRLSFTDGSLIPGIFCGLLFSVEFVLLFKALEFSSVARVSILFYTMPIWVAVAAHFLIPGEAMTTRRALGFALAVGGVALALSGRDPALGPQAFIGDLMALAGAVMWAGIALTARLTALSRSRPEMQLIYQLLVSGPLLLVIAWIGGDTVRALTPALVGIFAFQSIVIVAAGFLAWFWVLSIYPASDMASFGFLAPVFGVAAGWLILGEAISVNVVGALVLVGAGIALVNAKSRKRAA